MQKKRKIEEYVENIEKCWCGQGQSCRGQGQTHMIQLHHLNH